MLTFFQRTKLHVVDTATAMTYVLMPNHAHCCYMLTLIHRTADMVADAMTITVVMAEAEAEDTATDMRIVVETVVTDVGTNTRVPTVTHHPVTIATAESVVEAVVDMEEVIIFDI